MSEIAREVIPSSGPRGGVSLDRCFAALRSSRSKPIGGNYERLADQCGAPILLGIFVMPIAGYYVEKRLPDSPTATDHKTFQSFDQAFAWIEQQLKTEKTLCRILTRETLTQEQAERLARYNVQRI
jgi:hypothetical protein